MPVSTRSHSVLSESLLGGDNAQQGQPEVSSAAPQQPARRAPRRATALEAIAEEGSGAPAARRSGRGQQRVGSSAGEAAAGKGTPPTAGRASRARAKTGASKASAAAALQGDAGAETPGVQAKPTRGRARTPKTAPAKAAAAAAAAEEEGGGEGIGGAALAADASVMDRLAHKMFQALGGAFGSDADEEGGGGSSASDASDAGACACRAQRRRLLAGGRAALPTPRMGAQCRTDAEEPSQADEQQQQQQEVGAEEEEGGDWGDDDVSDDALSDEDGDGHAAAAHAERVPDHLRWRPDLVLPGMQQQREQQRQQQQQQQAGGSKRGGVKPLATAVVPGKPGDLHLPPPDERLRQRAARKSAPDTGRAGWACWLAIVGCTHARLRPARHGPARHAALPDTEPVPPRPSHAAGRGWFDLPATQITDEVKRDLRVLRLRGAFDPKSFYKKEDATKFPKYFQLGTVVESAADFYSGAVAWGGGGALVGGPLARGAVCLHPRRPQHPANMLLHAVLPTATPTGRLTNKQRKRTLTEEVLADADLEQVGQAMCMWCCGLREGRGGAVASLCIRPPRCLPACLPRSLAR